MKFQQKIWSGNHALISANLSFRQGILNSCKNSRKSMSISEPAKPTRFLPLIEKITAKIKSDLSKNWNLNSLEVSYHFYYSKFLFNHA
jgi:hypothetical protein